MVVTRQGTITTAASANGRAAVAPRARSPRRGAAQQRDPSVKKRGAPSSGNKRGETRDRGPLASPTEFSRAERSLSPPARPRRGRTPRVQLITNAEVIAASSGRSAGSKGPSKARTLLKRGLLAERLQTGPLPFVRQMSNMSDDQDNPEGSVPISEGPGTIPEGASGGPSASDAQYTATGRIKQGSGSFSSETNPVSLRSSSSSMNTSTSNGSNRLSEGKLGQLLLTYFCYASLYLTRKPFASSKRELQLQLGLSASALGGVDSAFLGSYAASQLLLAPALLGASRGPSYEAILAAAYAVSAASCFIIFILPDELLSPLSLSCLWGLNGAAQALAFPLIVSLLSTWLSSRERGGILGKH